MRRLVLCCFLVLNLMSIEGSFAQTDEKTNYIMRFFNQVGAKIIDNNDFSEYLAPAVVGSAAFFMVMVNKIKTANTGTWTAGEIVRSVFPNESGMLIEDLIVNQYFYTHPELPFRITTYFGEIEGETFKQWEKRTKVIEELAYDKEGRIKRLTKYRNIAGGLFVGFLGVVIGDLIFEEFCVNTDDGEKALEVGTAKIENVKARNVRAYLQNNPDAKNAIYDRLKAEEEG